MGETVEFPSNGGTGSGYLASPASGRGPGVLVIQEWWGLVPHIEDICSRLAAAGFVALAPDLYHGRAADNSEPDEAGKLMMAMQLDEVARDMLGAARWLLNNGRAAGEHVGIVGFCMGGALALYAATLDEVFAASVAFYPAFAAVEKANPQWTNVNGAVQGHFAEHDTYYDENSVEQFKARLVEAGVDVEVYWYPETEHAFFNDSRPEVHKPEASQQAWDRTIAFFRKHLAATPAPV